MSRSLADRFRHWFEYEKDSQAKVIASLHSVPAERRGEQPFTKAVMLMAHIVEARRIWLSRLGVAPPTPADFFPEGLSLEELESRVEPVDTTWTDYLKRVDDAELARIFDYRSYEGTPYRNSVEEVLTQMFGHSWYHRGQIASLVRAAGGEPAVTDYIFWTRQPIEAPTEAVANR